MTKMMIVWLMVVAGAVAAISVRAEGEGVKERTRLGRKSLAESVKDAEVIVVGSAVGSAPAPAKVKGDAPENLIRFEVKRVLKGVLEQEVVVTRTPTAAAEFIGKEWVVMLSPEYMAGRHQFGGIYGIGLEPQIQAALAKVVIVATAVEGKQLVKKEGEAAEVEVKFRVERVIKGKLAEQAITVRREGMVAEFVGREWVVMLSEKFMNGDMAAAEVYGPERVRELIARPE